MSWPARRDQGFDAVKMNGTEDLGWLTGPAAIDAAVERLGLVRDTGLDVGVDFHGRVHKPMAKVLLDEFGNLPKFRDFPAEAGGSGEMVPD